MLKTNVILDDGMQLGRYHRDNEIPKCVNRKMASKIVARKYQSYGVETTDEFGAAITLYLNGVAIGLREPV